MIHWDLSHKVSESFWSIFTLSSGSQVARLEHLQDASQAIAAYLPAGSGLGTYRYAVLPFQEFSSSDNWFHHADCMPVEWLVEGGVWMLMIMGAGITAMIWALSLVAQKSHSDFDGILAMGWFLLVSQLVACCFDFGILMPANYLTAALLVGTVMAVVPPSMPNPTKASASVFSRKPLVATGLAFLIMAILLTITIKITRENAQQSCLKYQWQQLIHAMKSPGPPLLDIERSLNSINEFSRRKHCQ